MKINSKDLNTKNFIFSRDYTYQDKQMRELLDEDGETYTHEKKMPFTSWPSPKNDQIIKYGKHTTFSGEEIYREIIEDYWNIDEFKKNQKLSLNFHSNYFSEKTNSLHRVLIDELGRKYDHDLLSKESDEDVSQGQTLTYKVTLISPGNFYPHIELACSEGDYSIGQKVTLSLIRELDSEKSGPVRIMKDNKNRSFFVQRQPYQQGEKYTPKSAGEEIEYEVDYLYDDHTPSFIELESTNPYFIQISQLSKSAQNFFHEMKLLPIYDKGNIGKATLNEQYENNNGNWVISFLNILNFEKNDLLNNLNSLELQNILNVIIEVNKTILGSGFLRSYSLDKRTLATEKTKRKIKESEKLSDLIIKINDPIKLQKLISKLKNSPIDQLLEDNDNPSFTYEIKHLIQYFESLIPNSIIEDFVNKTESSIRLRVTLDNYLRVRKKRVRSELFKEERDEPMKKISLKDNSDLKHLIFLSKIELPFLQEESQTMILNATLLRYEAYFLDSSEKIKESMTLLQSVSIKNLNIDEILKKQVESDYDFNMAQSYRFLAKHSSSLLDTISNYKNSAHYSRKIGSTKTASVDSGLERYFTVALKIENSESLKSIANYCFNQYKFYNQPDKRASIDSNPFLSELKEMFEILGMIGKSSIPALTSLFDFAIKKYSKDSNKLNNLYNSKIASLVLASNLLDNEKQDLLQTQLSKVFKDGAINIKDFSSVSADIDPDEFKTKKLVSAISNTETDILEHKGSWSLDIDKYIEQAPYNTTEFTQKRHVIREVAAFLNSSRGGRLFIGVLELKENKYKKGAWRYLNLMEKFNAFELDGNKNLLIGVDDEIKLNSKIKSLDDLMLSINQTLRDEIDEDMSKYISIVPHVYQEKNVIEIIIEKNSFDSNGWWIDKNTVLPHREGTSVYEKTGRPAQQWLKEMEKHFNERE